MSEVRVSLIASALSEHSIFGLMIMRNGQAKLNAGYELVCAFKGLAFVERAK